MITSSRIESIGGLVTCGEDLVEVVVEHSWLVAEAGERRVVAHRTNRVLVGLDERQQHEVHGL
jgi:hypothetical protein